MAIQFWCLLTRTNLASLCSTDNKLDEVSEGLLYASRCFGWQLERNESAGSSNDMTKDERTFLTYVLLYTVSAVNFLAGIGGCSGALVVFVLLCLGT